MKYLVDSDWIIDGLNGVQTAVATLGRLAPDGLAVSAVAFAEVVEGALNEPDPTARIADLRTFLKGYQLLPVTDAIALVFADRRATLRRQGTPVADLDLLIAATAIEHNLELLTRNRRHFARVPGLKLHKDDGKT